MNRAQGQEIQVGSGKDNTGEPGTSRGFQTLQPCDSGRQVPESRHRSTVRLQLHLTRDKPRSDHSLLKTLSSGTSLVAQWLRIRLPMQGTWVRSLVWEDPICRAANKPMNHNY